MLDPGFQLLQNKPSLQQPHVLDIYLIPDGYAERFRFCVRNLAALAFLDQFIRQIVERPEFFYQRINAFLLLATLLGILVVRAASGLAGLRH
jgi:hypothetical protein